MKQKYYILIFAFLLILSPINILFSQETSTDNAIIYVIYTYAQFIHTSMTQENESDFLYQMRYYGTNIEEGIENYLKSHRLVFRDENIPNIKKVDGYTREEANRILEYVEMLVSDDYFRNIFYLAVAWNICDYKIFYYNFSLSLNSSRNALEKFNEYTWAKTSIESRANILTISSPRRRYLLSFFDSRTYTRLGL
jgi:hypothetical protein